MEAQKISQHLPPVEASEIFKEVELTTEERELALLEARQKKAAKLRAEEYKKKLGHSPVYPRYTAEQLMEDVKKIHGFILDEYNTGIVENLCRYFTHDPRCTYDFKKGLLMYGPVGCGKTTLMEFFRHNQTNSFACFPVRDISDLYSKGKDGGSDAILRFKALLPSSDINKTFGQHFIGVCFDDLGTEVDKKHYGNESNVMAEILLTRYDRFKNPDHKDKSKWGKTHITTNLNTTQLEERYGKRVRSRLREMFNVVLFDEKAPDRRK